MLKIKHISIKAKLLILMISSISFALVTFGYFVLTDFKKDKLAYVMDTNADYSKSVAQQFDSEVESHLSQMNSYFERFDDKENKFAASALLSISKNFDIEAIYALTEKPQSDEIIFRRTLPKKNH